MNVSVTEPTGARKRMRIAEEIKWCLDHLSCLGILEEFPDTQVPQRLLLVSRRSILAAGLHLISKSRRWDLTDYFVEIRL